MESAHEVVQETWEEVVEAEQQKWDAWLDASPSAVMSALWIPDDLERTPVAPVALLEDPTLPKAGFKWLVPQAGPKERWRIS